MKLKYQLVSFDLNGKWSNCIQLLIEFGRTALNYTNKLTYFLFWRFLIKTTQTLECNRDHNPNFWKCLRIKNWLPKWKWIWVDDGKCRKLLPKTVIAIDQKNIVETVIWPIFLRAILDHVGHWKSMIASNSHHFASYFVWTRQIAIPRYCQGWLLRYKDGRCPLTIKSIHDIFQCIYNCMWIWLIYGSYSAGNWNHCKNSTYNYFKWEKVALIKSKWSW